MENTQTKSNSLARKAEEGRATRMPTVESFTYNGYDPWPDKMKYPINVHDSIFIVPFGKLNIPFEELKGGDDDVN